MRTSPEAPKGGPNDWPVHDYWAFVALVRESDRLRIEGCGLVTAVYEAARGLRLEGAEYHWLCEEVLAGCYGLFYGLGDCHVDAATFVAHANVADKRRLGPALTEWAEELAATPSNQRAQRLMR